METRIVLWADWVKLSTPLCGTVRIWLTSPWRSWLTSSTIARAPAAIPQLATLIERLWADVPSLDENR